MQVTRYFIADIEYLGIEVIERAIDFGWKDIDKRLTDKNEAIVGAIKFLATKDILVNAITIDTFGPKALPKPNDNTIMKCHLNDSIYELNTKFFTDECWDAQAFGILGCMGCIDQRKQTCSGLGVLTLGVNGLGNEIPLAKIIGSKPKRNNGKEEPIIDYFA